MRQLAIAARDVPAVVEQGQPGLVLVDRGAHARAVGEVGPPGLAVDQLLVARIALGHALGHAAVAPARLRADDVEEDAVGVVALGGLGHFGREHVEVGGVQAHLMETGAVIGAGPRDLAVDETARVLGVAPVVLLVEAGRKVDRRLHADRMRGGDLLAEQVDGEGGMLPAGRGRMVMPTVMALREHRDRIDLTQAQHILELLAGEGRADPGDLFAGVEIEVDLAEAHGFLPGKGLHRC